MKFKHFISASCLALTVGGVFSCSSDDNIVNGNENTGELETRYMSVTISYRGSTRATYNDGLSKESKLTKATLFFFNAGGAVANVCNNAGANETPNLVNYFTLPDLTQTANGSENITSTTPVQLIISTANQDKIPTKLVAVCNYKDADLNALKGLNYAQLKARIMAIADADSPAKNGAVLAEGDFIMSNTVFAQNEGEMFATPITPDNICATVAQSQETAHLAHVYVERVHAKVEAGITAPTPSGAPTYTYSPDPLDRSKDVVAPVYNIDGETNLFVALLGWNVSAVAPCTTLGKSINPEWPANLLKTDGSEPWNSLDYKRSFWAINPKAIVKPALPPYGGPTTLEADEMALQYGTYADAYKRGFGTDNKYAYIFENAATDYSDGEHKLNLTYGGSSNKTYDSYTQVVVPGILLKYDGSKYEPADICKWLGTEYTKDGLKTAMAAKVSTELYYFDSGDNKYKSITPADLDFETIQDINDGLTSGETLQDYGLPTNVHRRYAAWCCLSGDAGKGVNRTWYDKSVGEVTDPTKIPDHVMTSAQVNKYLKSLMQSLIWEGGLTYYYFDINHLGDTKGVVRNHWYKFDITKVTGLGTPVYDPSEIIIPEKVEDANSYISAHIDVLSWRIVNQNVVLGD